MGEEFIGIAIKGMIIYPAFFDLWKSSSPKSGLREKGGG